MSIRKREEKRENLRRLGENMNFCIFGRFGEYRGGKLNKWEEMDTPCGREGSKGA